MSKIQYCVIRDVTPPSRANYDDAGVDWYVPNFSVNEGFHELGENPVVYDNDSMKFLEDLKAKNANRDIQYVLPDELNKPLKIVIGPHERILIPSGIKVRIKRNWLERILYKSLGIGEALNAENKSGIANKKGLVIGSKVVDYGYRGEVHLSVINTTNDPVTIESGDKLVQFIHYPIFLSDYNRISEEEYNNLETTQRGTGGFGSSGTK